MARRQAIVVALLVLAVPAVAEVASRPGLPTNVAIEIAAGSGVHDAPVGVEIELSPLRTSSGEVQAPKRASLTAPGEQRFELPAGTLWQVRARAKGYFSPESSIAVEPGADRVARLRLYRTGILEAQVQSPKDGPAVRQLLVRFGPAPRVPAAAGDLPRGVVECPVLKEGWRCEVPAGALDLRIHDAGLVPIYQWDVAVAPGKTARLGRLVLRRGASVSGRIETEQGTVPARPCRVKLEPQSLASRGGQSPADAARFGTLALEARSNARGWFELAGVAPGSYVLKLEEPGYAPIQRAPIVVGEALQLELREPLVLLAPLTLELEISPALDPFGQPWRLSLFSRQEDRARSLHAGTASTAGRWREQNLEPGSYHLSVLGDRDERWFEQELRLERGQAPVHIDIPGVDVRGLVTLGKDPIAATLWFSTGDGRIRFDADQKGHFDGVLPHAGKWNVELASDSSSLRLTLQKVDVRVPAGKRAAELTIHIPDTHLAGEVVDSKGEPVEGAQVTLFLRGGNGSVTTDEKGEFEFRGLAPGSFGVEAELGDRTTGPVEVSLDEAREGPRVHLVLKKQVALVGSVVSATGPVPGAEVLGIPSVELTPYADVAQTVTDGAGGFDLRLPEGAQSVTLVVLPPGFALRMLRVTVDPSQSLTIPVDAAGGTLLLEIPDGSPPVVVHAGALTLVFPLAEWARLQGARAAAHGRLVVPNVEIGPYSLCRQHGELRRGGEPPTSQCASGLLTPDGSLELRIASPPR